MYRLLAVVRLILFALATIILIFGAVMLGLLLGTDIRRSMRMRRQWARLMAKLLGAKISFRGTPPEQPGLLVSNHRSYFDIIPVFYQVLVYPVAKIQVNSWPLIGYGSRQTGVLFVDREDYQQRRTILDLMEEKITAGFFVINYPEGTTHKDPTTIPFKMGAFRMALKNNFPVYPVAIDYRERDDAWVGEDTFIRHFLECFAKPRTEIKISFGQPIAHTDLDQLTQLTKNWIDGQLAEFQAEWAKSSHPKSV